MVKIHQNLFDKFCLTKESLTTSLTSYIQFTSLLRATKQCGRRQMDSVDGFLRMRVNTQLHECVYQRSQQQKTIERC